MEVNLMKLLMHQVRVLRLMWQSGNKHVLGAVWRRTPNSHTYTDAQRGTCSVSGKTVRWWCTRMETTRLIISL